MELHACNVPDCRSMDTLIRLYDHKFNSYLHVVLPVQSRARQGDLHKSNIKPSTQIPSFEMSARTVQDDRPNQ